MDNILDTVVLYSMTAFMNYIIHKWHYQINNSEIAFCSVLVQYKCQSLEYTMIIVC